MASKRITGKRAATAAPSAPVFEISTGYDPIQWLPELERALARGERERVALAAQNLATDENASHHLLVGLVRLLAKELDQIGDSHGKRGRPAAHKSELPWMTRREQRELLASHRRSVAAELVEDAMTAKDVLDGRADARSVAVFLLAYVGKLEGAKGDSPAEWVDSMEAMLRQDMPQAIGLASPYCEEFLQKFELSNAPRQGFKSRASANIAKALRLSQDQVQAARRKSRSKKQAE